MEEDYKKKENNTITKFTANCSHYISLKKRLFFPGWTSQMVKNEMWDDVFTAEKSSRELSLSMCYTFKARIELYFLLRYMCS